jgi:hypothetical protein
MSEQIEAGEGWRLLGPDEVVKDGDEPWHRFEKRWMYGPMEVPYAAKAYPAVRRRIPAKPEAMEIWTESGPVILNIGPLSVWVSQRWEDATHRVRLDETTQLRQVIAWLQQVADWREFQNTKTDAGQSRHET